MTPLERLLLFACSLSLAAALAGIGVFLSFWVMLGTIAGGALIAFLATLVDAAIAEERDEEAVLGVGRSGRDGLRQVPREETERRARESRRE